MADELPEAVQLRQRADFWYDQANIPVNLRSLDWDRFEGTPSEGVAQAAYELAQAWVDEESFRGLALFGKAGRGKTAIAATALCSLVSATIPRTLSGLFSHTVEGYFITLADLHALNLESFELDRWRKNAPDGSAVYEEWEKNFLRRRFIHGEVKHLVLDDVGKEHTTASGLVEDTYHALVRGRYARGLSTTITSNLSRPEFIEAYGQAQFSFLHEACRVYAVKGPDYRGTPEVS